MQVKVTLDTKRLKEVLDKILDNEILFKVTEWGVVLEGFNEKKPHLIPCKVEKDAFYFTGMPERLFPAAELYKWIQGEKIEIVFEKQPHVYSFRDYRIREYSRKTRNEPEINPNMIRGAKV